MVLLTFRADREKGTVMRREWELDEADFQLLANKSEATRLGFALILKFFEQEARFPRRKDVPEAAVEFMAGQVKVDAELFAECAWSGRGERLLGTAESMFERQFTETTMERAG